MIVEERDLLIDELGKEILAEARDDAFFANDAARAAKGSGWAWR